METWSTNKDKGDLKFEAAGLADKHLRILSWEDTKELSQKIENCEERLKRLAEEVSKALEREIPGNYSEPIGIPSYQVRFSAHKFDEYSKKTFEYQPESDYSSSFGSLINKYEDQENLPSIPSINLHPCSSVINFQPTADDITSDDNHDDFPIFVLNNDQFKTPNNKKGLGKTIKIVAQKPKACKGCKPLRRLKKKTKKGKPCKCVCIHRIRGRSKLKHRDLLKIIKKQHGKYQKNKSKRNGTEKLKQPYRKEKEPCLVQISQNGTTNFLEDPYLHPQPLISLDLKGVGNNINKNQFLKRPIQQPHVEPITLTSGSSNSSGLSENIPRVPLMNQPMVIQVEPVRRTRLDLNDQAENIQKDTFLNWITEQRLTSGSLHRKEPPRIKTSTNLNVVADNNQKSHGLPEPVVQKSPHLHNGSMDKPSVPLILKDIRDTIREQRAYLHIEAPTSLNLDHQTALPNKPQQRARFCPQPIDTKPTLSNIFEDEEEKLNSTSDSFNSILSNDFTREVKNDSLCGSFKGQAPKVAGKQNKKTEPRTCSYPLSSAPVQDIVASLTNLIDHNVKKYSDPKDPMEEHRRHFMETPVRETSYKENRFDSTLDIINQIGSIRKKLSEGNKIVLNVDNLCKQKKSFGNPKISHREKRPDTKPPMVKQIRLSTRKKGILKEFSDFKTIIFYCKMFVFMFALIITLYYYD